jgi:Tfp pilus assembly protein PilF
VSPRNVSALVLSGSAHILDGSPNQALDPLEAAERIAPQNADVQFNLGLAWLGVNRPDRAEAAWKRALELAPRYEQAAVNVIDLLIKTGRPREAETMMRTVRQTDLESPLLDYLEGKLAILRNDRPAARASLNRALAAGLPEPVAADARALLSAIQ